MRPVGDHALLLELPDNPSVHAAARLARERHGDQLEEIVPGHETLLLVWRDGSVISDISVQALERARSGTPAEDSLPDPVVVPVRYDGADLEDVAARIGVDTETVVELHSGTTYRVAFVGFSPGFPYLQVEHAHADAERLLALPRLETPRTEVAAGSVAVAAGYCGIYPRASPGGWNLLGRTQVVLFDADRRPPALLEPGARVRFEPV